MEKVGLNFKKTSSSIILLLCLATASYGQFSKNYNEAYEKGAYKEAAKEFDKVYQAFSFQLPDNELYNGACIYALNNEIKKAFEILEYLATFANYPNYNHVVSDTDLDNLHNEPQWEKIINQLKHNNLPIAEKAKEELLKAKKILETDNGKLWGKPIWDDRILVLAADNSVYALTPFAGSSPGSGGIILVIECNFSVVHVLYAPVGDGDLVRVPSQIFNHLTGAAKGSFGIDDPLIFVQVTA